MAYTNYTYNEAVGRLKLMLAEPSYQHIPKSKKKASNLSLSDVNDNYSDNISTIERPIYSDISKYLSPQQKTRLNVQQFGSNSPLKTSVSSTSTGNTVVNLPIVSTSTRKYNDLEPTCNSRSDTEDPQLLEALQRIQRQQEYIEQMERESKFYRQELSLLLNKVRKVINENEELTDSTRKELRSISEVPSTSQHLDNDEKYFSKRTNPERIKDTKATPNIIYEARISELEADLMQSQIDLKNLKRENEDLKRKITSEWPSISNSNRKNTQNCELHCKQIELLQKEKSALEETIRQLQKSLEQAKSEQANALSKQYINDLMQTERSQAELEVKHLRDELERQYERVRELQHQMSRRILDERANVERRYNNQVDQLGGDLSNQWEQVNKLQLELERLKRYESDLKRDLTNRNAQIDDLKMELKSNRSIFLADIAQLNAEKHSLEQEITSLRLQLDRSTRDHKTEAARLNAEINSLSQRLDRSDADLLHSKREVLRLQDEIANLEKELVYGELKHEIRPTKKDLDKRISEMQEKHTETVNELEEMIQSQKQLMDKLTTECKTLTQKLEDTTLKHKTEISSLQANMEYLTNRILNSEHLSTLDTALAYKPLTAREREPQKFKSLPFGRIEQSPSLIDDYTKSRPFAYETILGKSTLDEADPEEIQSTDNISNANYENAEYKPNYETGYDFKSKLNDDNDDENFKDNSGQGEKHYEQEQPQQEEEEAAVQEQDQQQLQQQQSQQETTNGNDSHTNRNNGIGEEVTGGIIEPNLAEYNTEYNTYENYDPQQYDATAYDTTYEQQQHYGGESEQYGEETGQYAEIEPIYQSTTDPKGYEYAEGEYDPSAYQYDVTGESGETNNQQGEQASRPTTTPTPTKQIFEENPIVEESTAGEISTLLSESSKVPTKSGPGQKQQTSKVSGTVANKTAEVTSRNQSRTGGNVIGSTDSGNLSGKSLLSKQSTTASNKK